MHTRGRGARAPRRRIRVAPVETPRASPRSGRARVRGARRIRRRDAAAGGRATSARRRVLHRDRRRVPLLRRRAPRPAACAGAARARSRHRRPRTGDPPREPAAPVAGRRSVLGLCAHRGRRRRQSLQRPSAPLPRRPRLPLRRGRMAEDDLGVRASLHGGVRGRGARGRCLPVRRAQPLQDGGGGGCRRAGAARGARVAASGLRRGGRRLEPVVCDALRGWRSQRRLDDGAAGGRARARPARPPPSGGRVVGSRGRGQVDPAPPATPSHFGPAAQPALRLRGLRRRLSRSGGCRLDPLRRQVAGRVQDRSATT